MGKWVNSNKYGTCTLDTKYKLDRYFIENIEYHDRIYQEDGKLKIEYRKGVVEIYPNGKLYYFVIRRAGLPPEYTRTHVVETVKAVIDILEDTVRSFKRTKAW